MPFIVPQIGIQQKLDERSNSRLHYLTLLDMNGLDLFGSTCLKWQKCMNTMQPWNQGGERGGWKREGLEEDSSLTAGEHSTVRGEQRGEKGELGETK